MSSGQGGLTLEIKCPCARKKWHEREVGVFFKWVYFCETMVYYILLLFLLSMKIYEKHDESALANR